MTAVGEINALADSLEQFPDVAVRRIVDGLARAVEPELRRDTGGDNRLSGVPGSGKLRVVKSVKGVRFVEGNVTAGPRKLRGPWRWLNDGTRPRVQGGGQHPGTPAKRTWQDPIDRALPALERELESEFEAAIR